MACGLDQSVGDLYQISNVILNNSDNSQCISESFFFIKLTLLQFISTNFWKQHRWSGRCYWKDKIEFFFWHFPSHWPASRAISLPYRLECCFWALLWSVAHWDKVYSSKISTKRSPVESNPRILVDSQYPGTCGAEKKRYWLAT